MCRWRWSRAGLATRCTRQARYANFLVSDEGLFREVFNAGRSGGATWPAQMLRLLPATAHGYGRVAEGRQHPLTPEGSSGVAPTHDFWHACYVCLLGI